MSFCVINNILHFKGALYEDKRGVLSVNIFCIG